MSFPWKPRDKFCHMGGGSGGGQGAGGSGLTTGGSATVYEPKNQGTFDTSFSNTLTGLFDNSGTTVQTNPYTDLYSGTLSNYQNYLDPSYGGYASTAATTATDQATKAASDYYTGTYPVLTGSTKPLSTYATTALDQASGVPSLTKDLPSYSSQTAATAFDPQGLLYDRERQKVGDYANVANSMAGLGSSPYGASVTTGALKDFDIDWQNNQLKRQASGASTLNSLASTYGDYTNAYGNYGKDATGAYTSIGNLGYGAGQGLDTLSYDPYYAGSQIGSNAITGSSNTAKEGASSYILPEDAMRFAESYLGLGQSASGLSNTVGTSGFNQTASEVGGGLTAANALLGSNSLLGGQSGIFGTGGLFGTSGGTGSSLGALGGDFGGGGELGVAGSGFLDSASAAAPAALT